MKVVNLAAMSRMDHEDVKERAGAKEGDRKKYRVMIIKKFIRWSGSNK